MKMVWLSAFACGKLHRKGLLAIPKKLRWVNFFLGYVKKKLYTPMIEPSKIFFSLILPQNYDFKRVIDTLTDDESVRETSSSDKTWGSGL